MLVDFLNTNWIIKEKKKNVKLAVELSCSHELDFSTYICFIIMAVAEDGERKLRESKYRNSRKIIGRLSVWSKSEWKKHWRSCEKVNNLENDTYHILRHHPTQQRCFNKNWQISVRLSTMFETLIVVVLRITIANNCKFSYFRARISFFRSSQVRIFLWGNLEMIQSE